MKIRIGNTPQQSAVFDRWLSCQLQSHLADLHGMAEGLFGYPHPGCACTPVALCGHHSAVYRHLQSAITALDEAVSQTEGSQ